MNWFFKFLTSSIGRKLIMSLTGLFLIIFLVAHLVGNLQLLISDGGVQFNQYAKFMTSNPLIKSVSYGLYFFILLHAIQGILVWRKNSAAKGTKYAVTTKANNSWASRNMGPLGVVVLIFILIHMYQFWLQMKLGTLDMVPQGADGAMIKDLYGIVSATYENIFFVIFYVVSMFFIAMHLSHGFQSAFQSLGINHKKYTPLIQFLGKAYSLLIPLGFAIIPIYFYFFR